VKKRDNLGDLGVDGANIKAYFKGIRCDDVDWIRLDQYRAHWQAPVNMVMNLRVPKRAEIFLNS
jgi:hypothetical protein